MASRALQLWPRLISVDDELLDSLELDPGAGGPILKASGFRKAWRIRDDTAACCSRPWRRHYYGWTGGDRMSLQGLTLW